MIIEELFKEICRQKLNVFSMCEYENGKYNIRQIQYANRCNNVYSVSKSITAMIVGILVDQGVLDFEETVGDIFDNGWNDVKLCHLLTHTTGVERACLDIDQDNLYELEEKDFLDYILKQPLIYEPGRKMVYSDANYYLISRIVSMRTGKKLQDIARELLFNPLSIIGPAWAVCPQGYAMGATGLFLSVEDMCRIGVLILKKGIWNETRIISQRSLTALCTEYTSLDIQSRDAYGYGFWLRRGTDIIMANGMLGQLIYVSPGTNRVISWQSCTNRHEITDLIEKLIWLDRN